MQVLEQGVPRRTNLVAEAMNIRACREIPMPISVPSALDWVAKAAPRREGSIRTGSEPSHKYH